MCHKSIDIIRYSGEKKYFSSRIICRVFWGISFPVLSFRFKHHYWQTALYIYLFISVCKIHVRDIKMCVSKKKIIRKNILKEITTFYCSRLRKMSFFFLFKLIYIVTTKPSQEQHFVVSHKSEGKCWIDQVKKLITTPFSYQMCSICYIKYVNKNNYYIYIR